MKDINYRKCNCLHYN